MRKTLLVFVILAAVPALTMAWPQPGDPAPNFTLPDSAGTDHQLTDYAGKVVMLNFWYAG
jgi:peroxiredoxin Q/BCP